jgi:hypothetical protein
VLVEERSVPLSGEQKHVPGLDLRGMVSHGRYVVFQMAEVAIPRQMSAAATTRASMKRSIVTRSRAIDRRNASRCQ